MRATLHDVAALAGVSIKTVSNVVNEFTQVSAATRERVLAAIAELGYQPNLTARNLRLGRTGVIGLALPEVKLSYFAELADGIIREADRLGVTVVIEQTNGDREREIEILSSPRRQMTDGLIFSPLGMSNDDAALLDVSYPLVLLGERIFDGPVDHVTMHNVDAAAAATRYLIDSGRRRIAVVGAHDGEIIGSAGLRLRGYRQALQEAGIEFDPQLIANTTLWHRSNGATAMQALLDSGVHFDAVFGLNDTLALGAMRTLHAAGRRIPEEVAVIGFDNLEESEFSLPRLTTVDPGRRFIATTAVTAILRRIADRTGATPVQRITAEFEIVERESTAPSVPMSTRSASAS